MPQKLCESHNFQTSH